MNEKLVEKLNLRCPHCQKLYEVETNLIQSSSPHFECLICAEVFSFQYPPIAGFEIKTFSVGNVSLEQDVFKKSCPKCKTLNSENSKECRSCQVVFEKYDLMMQEEFPGAKPHLVKLWNEYIADYENPGMMENFLNACFQSRDLDYADKKIRDLHTIIGPDLFCEQALHRVEVYRTQVKSLNVGSDHSVHIQNYKWYLERLFEFVTQKKFLMWFPIWVVGLLAFAKWTGLYQGPIFGAIISILLLHFGIIFFTQGRVQFSDFFKSNR